jgi:hypothetical protein
LAGFFWLLLPVSEGDGFCVRDSPIVSGEDRLGRSCWRRGCDLLSTRSFALFGWWEAHGDGDVELESMRSEVTRMVSVLLEG